ncbi:family 78 glycoside hydrolase catalytic domain [Paenibacillus eucommiae]|uniref:alpha-L-rhamnosidase n=1 Tax=Paenibacillus eucommiae TaxID=1355755 RepID=A0ABS4J3U4_9BACL|nr:family 78 glycoside hydrolase catalytic domain [Paenibacillus eucommiae]MBP1994512.1 hypothetical protein [Paenibacillus eucommiae]
MLLKNLRVEYIKNPLGIGTNVPRFSWELEAPVDVRGVKQSAYRILVATDIKLLEGDTGDLWDSKRVDSNASVSIEYAGAGLASGQYAVWKVMVWDQEGQPVSWSEAAMFTIGLLDASDWHGSWIGMASAAEKEHIWVRKTFTLERIPTIRALAYMGSVGYHELYINGAKVGDQLLAPSVSNLQVRAHYVTYDIQDYLQEGKNVIALWLAAGWAMYTGANEDRSKVYDHIEKGPLVIGQFDMQYENEQILITTKEDWKCALSPSKHIGGWGNNDFGGEQYDSNKYQEGWNHVEFADENWESATSYSPGLLLSPDLIPPNRRCEVVSPISVIPIERAKWKVDMGKLFTGWIEVELKGSPGDKVTLAASSDESLEYDFNQVNEIILDNNGRGRFSNRFTYQEFRFITIQGTGEELSILGSTGYRIGNDFTRVGSFECSEPLINNIYRYTLNTYVNLTTGGMTVDCPNRERKGYGGDAHTSLELSLMNYDSHAYLARWAQDWCDVQQPDGWVPHTAPTIQGGGGPAWSGYLVMMPWEVYQTYGDLRLLERVYPFMKNWMKWILSRTQEDGLLLKFGGYWDFIGDWLTPHGSEEAASPDALLFNNCYYLLCLRTMSDISSRLELTEDAEDYVRQADRLVQAINARFLDPERSTYIGTRQIHCVMPLLSQAVPQEHVDIVRGNLRDEILIHQKGHLDTGLHGTYYMTKYLTEQDDNELIFKYASQTSFPGYGYLISQGYQTWPEYWEGAPSKIHGCFNGIGGWFQRGVLGIRNIPGLPGYQQFVIKPGVISGMTWASGHYETLYGKIECIWTKEEGGLVCSITVPVNTQALLYLPAASANLISEGGQPLSEVKGVYVIGSEDNKIQLLVESGAYTFQA